MAKHEKAGKTDKPALPRTRAELLVQHETARRKRNAASLGGKAWTEASMEVVRIEVEIARIERAMDPPAA